MIDHLTDDQIQQWLDGTLANRDKVASHLDQCPQCYNAVANYKLLFAGLGEEVDFSLSADFSDSVIEQIPELNAPPAPPATSAPIFKISDGVIGFAAIATLVAVAMYFFDLLAIGTATRQWSVDTLASSSAIFNTVKQFLSAYGISPLMVLFAVVTISAILVIDQIIIGMKKNRRPMTYSI